MLLCWHRLLRPYSTLVKSLSDWLWVWKEGFLAPFWLLPVAFITSSALTSTLFTFFFVSSSKILYFLTFYHHSSSDGIQTLDLRFMSWVFYHIAMATGTPYKSFSAFSQHSSSDRIQTLDLRIMSWVFYHYATASGTSYKSFLPFSLLWFKGQDSNPRSKNYELSVLPLCYSHWKIL
jgi:hypothetical protein